MLTNAAEDTLTRLPGGWTADIKRPYDGEAVRHRLIHTVCSAGPEGYYCLEEGSPEREEAIRLAGVHICPPLPDVMTVIVRDRAAEAPWGYGMTRPVTRKVTISAYCQHPGCQARRGRPKNTRQHDDGATYYVHTWDNPCGHVDQYAAVVREARKRGTLGNVQTH